MSGIRTGTRLEQLQDLRRQIQLRIQYERAHGTDTTRLRALLARVDAEITAEQPSPPAPPPRSRKRGPNVTDRLLVELGVTSNQVKVWAVEHGLLDQVRRGRIALQVVREYAAAHNGGHP